MPYLTWLADVLRKADLKVVEQPGWKTRGRSEMGTVRGVLCHHTAGPRKGNAPSLSVVQNGRGAFSANGRHYPAVPGPLAQLVLGRDGTFFVIAAGRANHAGAGSWQGITTGGHSFIGIEAENVGDGTDPWPTVQTDAYAHGVAALLVRIDAPPIMCAGHKEYALPRGRKVDPTFDMPAFRDRVAHIMGLPTNANHDQPAPVPDTDPHHAMLRLGDRGDDVKLLQGKLGLVPADGIFGPATERAVKAFQARRGLTADGLVGPKTWAALAL